MHILPNISRNKSNQKMILGQLIENNMTDFFIDKPYTKCSGETILRPFSKKSKLSRSLDLKYYIVCFYCKLRTIKID